MCAAPAKANPGVWGQPFAGTPTTRVGLGRASASAENNPLPFAIAWLCHTPIHNYPLTPETEGGKESKVDTKSAT